LKATQLLENLGQSLWLDNITATCSTAARWQHYIDELSGDRAHLEPLRSSTTPSREVRHTTTAFVDAMSKGKTGRELFSSNWH